MKLYYIDGEEKNCHINEQQRDNYVKWLEELYVRGPILFQYGICRNLSEMHSKYIGAKKGTPIDFTAYFIIEYMSEGWPLHSGFEIFPIEEDDSIPKWAGNNLIQRQSLIKYIIGKLKEINFEEL